MEEIVRCYIGSIVKLCFLLIYVVYKGFNIINDNYF